MTVNIYQQYDVLTKELNKLHSEYKEKPSPQLEEIIKKTQEALKRLEDEIKSEYNL